ncbi:MAG: 4Fe-4S dicluster domain-containing protein [Chloroflexi bacterium]|nr:4Fe-4S dicluster domain-containing protein [Chloroflexota bacterium]
MEAKTLRRDRFSLWIAELLRDYEVIAPRDELAYGRIEAPEEIWRGSDKPHRPLKEFFFPQRETLFGYQVDGAKVTLDQPPHLEADRVVLTRPCDAAALTILDKVFFWDYQDALYREKRERTTIVSIACEQPCETCFCTSVGGSPADIEGADLMLAPLEESFHVQVLSDKGKALIEHSEALFGASTEKENQQRALLEDAWRQRIGREVDIQNLAEKLDFDSPIWEALTEQCIDCCICTFLCPTCHCFDIQDEGDPLEGERVRLWDSCATRLFTKTAVHQPRATHASRYRQRIMHKFQYYPKNFGRTLCVGCGRCIDYCPMGIDITAVLQAVKEYAHG